MKLRSLFSGAALAWMATAGSAAAAQRPHTVELGIDRLFAQFSSSTPGCALAVAKDGRTIIERAYGQADLEHDVPNTPKTLFEAGSISKQFTSAAILLLAGDGKLKLTDDVRTHIPELPDYGQVITIDHLMNHTSGLRDWPYLFHYSGLPRGSHVYSLADILDMAVRQRSLNHAPGEEYNYTSTGYSLMALIVQRVSGKSLAEFTRDRVFLPLGMNSTQWRDDFRRVVKNRAIAYERTSTGYVQSMPFENAYGAGGLLTTAGDLLIWNEALSSGRLGPAVSKQLQTPGKLKDGRPLRYGRGVHVKPYRNQLEISHGGTTAAYRAWLGRYPDQRLSIAVLCNASDGRALPIGHEIADRMLPAVGGAAAAALPPVDPAGKAGLFVDEKTGFPMRLAAEGGRLRIAGGAFLDSASANRFRYPEGELVFETPDAFKFLNPLGPTGNFRRASAPDLSTAALKRLTGRYSSDELGASYVVALENGALIMRRDRRPDMVFKLDPIYLNAFEIDHGLVRFHDGRNGRTAALSMGAPGARNVRFVRERP